ncbi:MAG TPA: fibronectin type III domain-containing protein, partial [Treponemataceae bacterium]|nr:fibronectin type III domain-containing protein [Treponemataceae bacterium]
DGEAAATPVLTSISLKYREDTPPWPPVRLRAEPGDGFVTLSWPASIDHDTSGYLVYWGTRPGEYLGSGSPLDAGKNLSARIENLENGVLYYFSVAAYDAAGKTHQGPQSAEASVRPLAVYGSGGN